jgi:hypothetical protein
MPIIVRRNITLRAEAEERLSAEARRRSVSLAEVVRERLVEIGRQQPEDPGPPREFKVSVEPHVWEAALTTCHVRRVPLQYLL